MISVQDFSSKIKKKYPQYNHVDDNTLAQKMIAKYPQYKDQVQMDSASQVGQQGDTFGGLLKGFGLGGATDTVKQFGENLGKPQGIIGQPFVGTPSPQQMQQQVQKAPQAAAGAGALLMPGAKGIASIGTGAARGEMYGIGQGKNPIESLPYAAGGAVVEPLMQLLGNAIPFLSKKGVAGQTEEAVQSAPKSSDVDWTQLETDVRKNVENKLGNSPEVKSALEKALAEKTPQFGLGEGDTTAMQLPKDMSPEELLQWRRQISARGASSGILQNLFKGTNVEDKVNSVLRDTISQTLHEAVPGTMTPDKLYSLYSKMGGDVPQWVTRLLAGWAADKTVGKQFGPAYEPLIDLGAGALAGRLPIP